MEVKHITWVGLSSGWSSQKKGHLSVGNSLFRQIVINDQSVFTVVSEIFTDGATGVWGQELQWRGLGRGSGDHNGVWHSTVLLKVLDNVSNGGSFLTNSNVDAVELLVFLIIVEILLLVDNGVDG